MTTAIAVTDDAFLGGQLSILQPREGYRAGLDAVMLAASVSVPEGQPLQIADLGAGVGTAGLCVAARCPSAHVLLIERERALADLARENVRRNNLADRVTVLEADIGKLQQSELVDAGRADGVFDRVIANPPYHSEGTATPASHALKAASHAMPQDGLEAWCRTAARLARPGGRVGIIHRAAALPALLAALERRFGALLATPLHARAGEAAHRILIEGVKGSRAPFRLAAGFVIHVSGDRFTAGAEAVLRQGLALSAAYGLSAPRRAEDDAPCSATPDERM